MREQDGLALSSRNVYLSQQERTTATILYRGLKAGAAAIRKGIRNGEVVQEKMIEVVRREPGVTIDYLAVCDPLTLEPLKTIVGRSVLLGAIRVGVVRLIDNIVITR